MLSSNWKGKKGTCDFAGAGNDLFSTYYVPSALQIRRLSLTTTLGGKCNYYLRRDNSNKQRPSNLVPPGGLYGGLPDAECM